MDKLTPTITMKTKLNFISNENKNNNIKMNIIINSNHVFDQHNLRDFETYLQNYQISHYTKEKKQKK